MDQHLNHVRGFSFGGMTYERGGLFGPILRPYLSLVMVEAGCCTLKADGKLVKITSGQTGIAAAESKFEFAYQKDVQTTVVWCEGFLPHGSFSSRDNSQANLAPIATTANMQKLCQIGLETGHTSRPDLNSLRDALGQAVCRAYVCEARKDVENQSIPRHILKARRFIDDNLGSDAIDVSIIAAEATVTPQHLITSFKKHIGTTPSRYLWQVRANRARQLLIHTQYSQSEIAHLCGYNSLPHYSRSIKNLFGMTPAQLRRDMGFTKPSNADDSVRDLVF